MILDFTDLSVKHTKRLNQIAHSIMQPYTSFIDDCCRKYGNNYLFWATPFASRNIFNDSNLFLSLCRILLAKECLREHKIDSIITEYKSEGRVLRALAGRDVAVNSIEKFNVRDWLRRIINNVLFITRFCIHEICYLRSSRRYALPKYDCPISLIFFQVSGEDFDELYFRDRFFTGITEYKDVIFYPDCLLKTSLTADEFIDKIENCTNYQFLNGYHFRKSRDLFEIFRYWQFIHRIRRDEFVYGDMDISPIIYRCLSKGRMNITSYKGLLDRIVIHRMKDAGIEIRDFILWYEGRPSDVMVASAVRAVYSNANCVGYEGYSFEELNMSEFISEFQYQSRHAPCAMAIPGKAFEQESHQFCDKIPLLHVPILRNQYTFNTYKAQRPNNPKVILLLLSYFLDVTRELLIQINKYAKGHRNCRILIKNHPTCDGYTVEDYGINDLVFQPEYVTGRLSDCLAGVDVVMASITTAGLEVLFANVPLVMVFPKGRIGVTSLPIQLRRELCKVVYDYGELSMALNASLNGQDADYSLLNGMLAPRTKESILLLFQ